MDEHLIERLCLLVKSEHGPALTSFFLNRLEEYRADLEEATMANFQQVQGKIACMRDLLKVLDDTDLLRSLWNKPENLSADPATDKE